MAGRHPEGSRTSSVTHINSYSNETDERPVSFVELFAKLASGENAPKKIEGFARNPILVKQEAVAMQAELERARGLLIGDGPAVVITSEALKRKINASFSAGDWRAALVGYVAGIWLLRTKAATCPSLVPHALSAGVVDEVSGRPEAFDSRLSEVTSWLRVGVDGAAGSSGGPPEDEEEFAIWKSLHLNLAATALKLAEYTLAIAACDVVLAIDNANGKALFRLAKAHEGMGELGKAVTAATAACKAEPQNSESRKLWEGLRSRHQQEKAKFAGKANMFGAASEADPLSSGGGGGGRGMVWSAASIS